MIDKIILTTKELRLIFLKMYNDLNSSIKEYMFSKDVTAEQFVESSVNTFKGYLNHLRGIHENEKNECEESDQERVDESKVVWKDDKKIY